MIAPGVMQFSRRELIRLGGASAALAATPLAARGFGRGFTHGVASGEPTASGVLLWTRFVAEGETRLTCEVSETTDFSRPVAGGEVMASPQSDYCAKLAVDGLGPGRWYFYRFIASDGSRSDIGRTRTLPRGPVAKARMAVFSCANFGFGMFNAYAHAANADDFELALHLGDYIYEYGRGTYPAGDHLNPQRSLWPQGEAISLADYRLRYATYRTDPDLRRIHQLYPMIAIWDDHETANDAWKGGAQNHDPASEGDWQLRKAAAKRAHSEWLPVSDAPYAQYELGDLATIFRLDTRLLGREKQFDLGAIVAGIKNPEEAMAALKAFREGAWADPDRQLLGAAQQGWLAAGLRASRGEGKVWQVLAQQIVMGRLKTPPGLLNAIGPNAPHYVRKRLAAAALASKAGLPANMDAWDGYPAAREKLLASALDADANLVVLSGDSHNGWAFDLNHSGAAAGVEFAGHSVTSPGLEDSLRQIAPGDFARDIIAANPQLKWADTSQRGYMMVELTRDRALSEYRFVDTIATHSSRLAGFKRIESKAGSRALSI